VDSLNPFPSGTVVELCLKKESRSFKAPGRVVYSMVGLGMGVAFTDTDPQQVHILEKWIGELSGDLPADPDTRESSTLSRAQVSLQSDECAILKELILVLMQQGVLPDANGGAMLKRLHP
jgi:hypothetical protein